MIIIIMAIILTIVSGILVRSASISIASHRRYALPHRQVSELSIASKRLIQQYRTLPEENRPYANISNIVKALDVKYGVKEVNDHFRVRDFDAFRFGWECECVRYSYRNKRCTYMSEYAEMHKAMEDITESLKARDHAIELRAVEEGLSQAKEFAAELRREKEIIASVTKELK